MVSGSGGLYENLHTEDIIRLVKLDPEAAKLESGYQLRSFTLKEAPPYHALSYAWGSVSQKVSIIINSQKLQISQLLYATLEEICPIPEIANRWFWIDQISVNQNDLDERAHQVQLMRDIYSRSEATVIYIGPFSSTEDAEIDPLLGKIIQIWDKRDDLSNYTVTDTRLPPVESLTSDDLLTLGLPPRSAPIWGKLDRFLEKDYLCRIWVVQEAVLSPQTPILIYGGRTRSWPQLLKSFYWLDIKQCLMVEYARPVMFLCWMYLSSLSKYPWDLQLLLYMGTRCSDSTDPRDKLYALFGMAFQTQDKESYPPILLPNYRKSVGEVFQDATKYLMISSRNLFLLSLTEHSEQASLDRNQVQSCSSSRKDGLPSWVPKYHGASQRGWFPIALELSNEGTLQPSYTRSFDASNREPAQIKETADPNALVVRGIKLGSIDWRSPPQSADEQGRFARWFQEALPRFFPSKYSTIDKFIYDYLAVLKSRKPGRDAGQHDFWAYLREQRDRLVDPTILSQAPEASFGQSYKLDKLVESYNLSRKTFFCTNGEGFGVGPTHVENGDIVSVLFGSEMPYVLRPCKDHFHLIGWCFVHGIMDGEIVQRWKEGNEANIKSEWLEIR
jgi:heterokaryon incompatibility protein (HET)